MQLRNQKVNKPELLQWSCLEWSLCVLGHPWVLSIWFLSQTLLNQHPLLFPCQKINISLRLVNKGFIKTEAGLWSHISPSLPQYKINWLGLGLLHNKLNYACILIGPYLWSITGQDPQMTSPLTTFCLLSKETNSFHVAMGLFSKR